MYLCNNPLHVTPDSKIKVEKTRRNTWVKMREVVEAKVLVKRMKPPSSRLQREYLVNLSSNLEKIQKRPTKGRRFSIECKVPPHKTTLQSHIKICQMNIFWSNILWFFSGPTVCLVGLYQSQVGICYLIATKNLFCPSYELYFNAIAGQFFLNSEGRGVRACPTSLPIIT